MTGDIATPRSIKADPQSLHIEWSDGVTHRLPWRLLRERCPCATCRDKRLNPPAEPAGLLPVLSMQEAQPLRGRSMKPVGNYAYGIDFTDGHTTGIYTLEYLRELGEEAATAS